MELRQLKHLICLAECGSFSRAAEQLHLTQSALSRSIQALESSLGVPLVDRLGKRNELTPVGHWVTERARRVLFEAHDLQEGLQHLNQAELGTLRVGLGSGPGALLMTPLLQHMARHHPGVKVSVSRGATELQLQALRERQLDALVVDLRRVAPAEDLRTERLTDMQAAFIARAGHPLLRDGASPPFAALLHYPIATTPLSDEVARLLVDRYGEAANPEQMVSLRCEDVSSLLDTVAQTDALFLGIRAAARAGIEAGLLVEVRVSPPLHAAARFGLITLRGRTESPLMGLLRDFVRRQLHD